MHFTKGVAIGTEVTVSAIGRVVAYRGWSLRGVPLYIGALPSMTCGSDIIAEVTDVYT